MAVAERTEEHREEDSLAEKADNLAGVDIQVEDSPEEDIQVEDKRLWDILLSDNLFVPSQSD